MRKLIFLLFFFTSPVIIFAQATTFDITTYTPPKGWIKKATPDAVQFTKSDEAKGTYCLITLYKSLTGDISAKSNFDLSWNSLVKDVLGVSAAPQMQAPDIENGWEAHSGYASFESGGQKGVVLLVTSTSAKQMVNIMILTNTEAYQQNVSDFLESINFKKPAELSPEKTDPSTNPVNNQGINSGSVAKSDGFAFNTTNFDDGWTAVQQEDWVLVTKAGLNVKVLVHYPNKQADAYNSVMLDGLKNAWNILVAPRYSSGANLEFKPVSGWQTIFFAEGDLVEKGSGKKVHVVLFKLDYSNGSGKFMEFITPDKKTFEQQFGPYHQDSYGWENLEKFANYNKFAVAASDLKGKWTNNFSGAIQYVNVNTGLDSYMDTHTSVENFSIGTNNTYTWEISVASGPVGNIRFQSRKNSGKITMNGNWKVNFSNIDNRPRSYDIYFSCIKGLRVLWLDGKPFARIQ